ncbi:MAG: gluconokinase [Ferruginibacter sp.]
MQHKVIYIMGVSGSGKTTVGQKLSKKTGYQFYDADDFHSAENKAKMKQGIALTDQDRWPWLENIHQFVIEKLKTENIILGCSALKKVYRKKLSQSIEKNCRWFFLEGDYKTIQGRLEHRKGHYMSPGLLQSQFDALEIPATAKRIDIKLSPDAITDSIISSINNN